MPKGKKQCECTNFIACRSLQCEYCGKVQPRPVCPEIDWRNLEVGTRILSRRNFGPYFESPTKGRVYLGTFGELTVSEILPEGIMAIDKKGTRHFLYMATEKPSELAGMLSPHGIEVVKTKTKKVK